MSINDSPYHAESDPSEFLLHQGDISIGVSIKIKSSIHEGFIVRCKDIPRSPISSETTKATSLLFSFSRTLLCKFRHFRMDVFACPSRRRLSQSR